MKRLLNYKALTVITLLWTLFVSILRSIRMPNDFAEAHWLLDYRHGFIKRGLAGSIYSLMSKMLGFDISSETIFIFSSLAFAGFIASLIFIIFRIIIRHNFDNGIVLMLLVFVSSPYIVMKSHVFGYLDLIIIMCAVVSVVLTMSNRFFWAMIISSSAMLIHENYLIIGIPFVFFASIIKYRQSNSRSEKIFNISAFILPLLVFLFIVFLQMYHHDNLQLRKELISHLSSFDFISTRSRHVAIWQTIDFMTFFNDQKDAFFDRLFHHKTLITFIPTLFVILFSIHSTHRITPFSMTSLFILLIVLIPLPMHLVAFDTARISIYTIGSAIITHWILSETRSTVTPENNLFTLAALPVLIVNVFSETRLMDNCTERFSIIEKGILYAPALIIATSLLIRLQIEKKNS